MPQYPQALDAMHRLLMDVSQNRRAEWVANHWKEWIAQDMEKWRESRSVKHHLSAYGGMGSFNDIDHFVEEARGPLIRALFNDLKSVCYVLAKNHGRDLDETALLSTFQPPLGGLNGWRCRHCGYAQTSVAAIESHLPVWRMPRLVVRAVAAGRIVKVVMEVLAGRVRRLDADRKDLLTRCRRAGISIVPRDEAIRGCPECGSEDTTPVTWLTVGELTPAPEPRRTRKRRGASKK